MLNTTIITCAITGSIHTPSMSPYLPITPDEIIEAAVGAAKAGAAILHLHARDPKTGAPSADPEIFAQFLPEIRNRCDAIINITTGGSQTMTLAERLAAPLRSSPEMCSLNMGSMNFGLFPMLGKPRDWNWSWEPDYLEGSRDGIFRNTFKDIEQIIKQLWEQGGTRFEFECYDVGHLYNLRNIVDRGLIAGPLFIQFVLGILGGIGAEVQHLVHMNQTANQLFGDSFEWSVLGAGRHQMPMAVTAAAMGGNVRVGLEDNLYIGKGELARDNASQVSKMRHMLEDLSMVVATPDEARQRLALKGAAATKL